MEAKPIVKIAVQYPANLRVFSLSLLHTKYFTFSPLYVFFGEGEVKDEFIGAKTDKNLTFTSEKK